MAFLRRLFHYSNIEALISGIIPYNEKLKDQNDICLWATHCEFLNDPVDTYYGESLIYKNNDIKKILQLASSSVSDNIRTNYILSFSENKDSLPMWNMYGKNGKGIALGFDFEMLLLDIDLSNSIHRCIYENTPVFEKYFSKIINGVKEISEKGIPTEYANDITDKNQFLAGMIHGYSKCIKSQSYQHEKEWRIIIPAYDNKSKIEFRYSSGVLIPYIKIFFPKKVLKDIWIGPTNDMKRSERSIKMFLDSNGFEDVKIFKSEIPFR